MLEVQICPLTTKGAGCGQLIFNDRPRSRLVEQDTKLVPRSELFDHFELGEGETFERACPVEPDKVVVACSVEAVDLVKYDVEHGEGVKLLVDELHLLPDDGHAMLHTEEAIADD